MKIDQQRRCKSVKKSVATYEQTTISHILYFFYMTTSLFITHNIIKLFVMSPKENLHHHSNTLNKIFSKNSAHEFKSYREVDSKHSINEEKCKNIYFSEDKQVILNF